MKIAIPTNQGVVDDHFGHCAYYTICDIENGEIISQERLESPQGCGCKSNIASILSDMGVKVMLAGSMGDGAKNKLEQSSINVIRGCKGSVDTLINSYLKGFILDSGEGCSHTHGDDDHVCPNH